MFDRAYIKELIRQGTKIGTTTDGDAIFRLSTRGRIETLHGYIRVPAARDGWKSAVLLEDPPDGLR